MNIYGLSGILGGITGLFMAVFIYAKGYNYKLARDWSIFSITAAIYGFGAAAVTYCRTPEEAAVAWQFAYIGIILLPYSFVCLVHEFLGITNKPFIRLMRLGAAVFLLANFFSRPLFIKTCTLYFSDIPWVKPIYFVYPPGILLYIFIILYFGGLVIYAHFELIRNYAKTSALKRIQAKYFIFSSSIAFAGGAPSFLPCFGISLYPFFNFTVPIYFLILSYAILRHRLMDLNVVFTRTGIFLAVYTLALGIPFAITARLKPVFVRTLGENWWILPAGSIAVLATIGTFIYIFLQKKADDRMLKEQRRYQEILKHAGNEMSRIHNLQALLNFVITVIADNVQISHLSMFLADEEESIFLRKACHNVGKEQPEEINSAASPIISWLRENQRPLFYDEIRQKSQEESGKNFIALEESLRKMNTALIGPILSENRLLGFIMLGSKKSGKVYTSEDINVFSVLASQTALAIENALLYENIEEEVRQRTKELVDVQRQLVQAEKMATVGTLAGGVAHEINNPLTAVLTNAQMLLAMGTDDKEFCKESLEIIEQATKRCKTIVQKLMTYAKKPTESVSFAKIDILKALKTVSAFLEYQLQQENIKLTVTTSGRPGYPVIGNNNEIEQVLTNIIVNARDAIKQIKKEGTIEITVSSKDEWVYIVIKDEGAGIPKEIFSKIFDPFFTTKDVGKGLGLGLSICQSIMEKHNGFIKIDSSQNEGTTVTLKIPAAMV